MSVSVIGAFLAGMASFASPCILPLVPSYLGYISGISLAEVSRHNSQRAVRKGVFIHAFFFVVGFSLIFILLGATATALGRLLLRYQSVISRIGGGFVVLMGLFVLGIVRPGTLNREWRFFPKMPVRPRYPMSVLAGVGFGAGWTPCIGPFLGSILLLAAGASSIGMGMTLLGIYALGLALPFLTAALGYGWILRRTQSYLPVIQKVSGGVMIVMGGLLLMGWYEKLSQYLVYLLG